MGRWKAIVAPLLALTLSTPAAGAPVLSPSGIDPRLVLEWEAGQDRRGRPIVSGYVHNNYDRAAYEARVLVETLDAGGQPIAQAMGFVFGTVPIRGRSYFEVRIKTPGPSYRVTVTSFDWRDGAGP
jgi:hypothetical protein